MTWPKKLLLHTVAAPHSIFQDLLVALGVNVAVRACTALKHAEVATIKTTSPDTGLNGFGRALTSALSWSLPALVEIKAC